MFFLRKYVTIALLGRWNIGSMYYRVPRSRTTQRGRIDSFEGKHGAKDGPVRAFDLSVFLLSVFRLYIFLVLE